MNSDRCRFLRLRYRLSSEKLQFYPRQMGEFYRGGGVTQIQLCAGERRERLIPSGLRGWRIARRLEFLDR